MSGGLCLINRGLGLEGGGLDGREAGRLDWREGDWDWRVGGWMGGRGLDGREELLGGFDKSAPKREAPARGKTLPQSILENPGILKYGC